MKQFGCIYGVTNSFMGLKQFTCLDCQGKCNSQNAS